jgi:hypothetical protein
MRKWIALILVVLGLLIISISVIGGLLADSTTEKSEVPDMVEKKPVPVIVELFTSEGCSSCPPSDALLARLEKTQPIKGVEVIALAQHVDYWNYLGWKDPFSRAEFSARQGEYARAFGRDGVYTPQMIIDGHTEFPGGNHEMANRTIAEAAKSPKSSVQLTLLKQNQEEAEAVGMRLRVKVERLPALSNGETADVLLAVTESDLTTAVARGENSGRRLSHTGVVRSLRVIGSVDRQNQGPFIAEPAFEVRKEMRRENLRVVVFVQERASRRVLGAGMVKLAG